MASNRKAAAIEQAEPVQTFSYYGSKCTGFLFGTRFEFWYVWFYVGLVTVGAVASLRALIGIIDGMYAAMAIPTMVNPRAIKSPHLTPISNHPLHDSY